MPPRPHVTVLMAVRDGARHLAVQLDSINAQQGVDWSLWASDDGSTDESRSMIRRFAADHPGRDIRLLEGPGKGAAANFLSLLCRDDLPTGPIALSDQDDEWFPQKLSQAVNAIGPTEATPRLYGAHWIIADRDLQPIAPSPTFTRTPSLENALVQNIVSGHTTVMNTAFRDIVRGVGHVDIPFHDWWLYQLATATGSDVILDPEAVLLYRQHGSNVAGTKRGIRPSLRRVEGLFDGTMSSWMRMNIRALRQASSNLTPEARALLDMLPNDGRIGLGCFRRAGLHRQTPGGTAALYLAAAAGRL